MPFFSACPVSSALFPCQAYKDSKCSGMLPQSFFPEGERDKRGTHPPTPSHAAEPPGLRFYPPNYICSRQQVLQAEMKATQVRQRGEMRRVVVGEMRERGR